MMKIKWIVQKIMKFQKTLMVRINTIIKKTIKITRFLKRNKLRSD